MQFVVMWDECSKASQDDMEAFGVRVEPIDATDAKSKFDKAVNGKLVARKVYSETEFNAHMTVEAIYTDDEGNSERFSLPTGLVKLIWLQDLTAWLTTDNA